jgi:hypothetical protein
MARRKHTRSKGRRRYHGRRGKKVDRAVPVAAAGGLLAAGADVLFDRSRGNNAFNLIVHGGPAERATGIAWIKDDLTHLSDRNKPALYGVLISGAKYVPVAKVFAKPIDKVFRKLSRGKLSL